MRQGWAGGQNLGHLRLFFNKPVFMSFSDSQYLLYPRHLCRWVYSFRLSICPFVYSFVPTSFRHMEFASKFCVKVFQVVYISATTY